MKLIQLMTINNQSQKYHNIITAARTNVKKLSRSPLSLDGKNILDIMLL